MLTNFLGGEVSGTMPRAVFAGIFIVVGWGSIEGNMITQYTLYLLRDKAMTPDNHPLKNIRKISVLRFVLVQWFVFGVAYAMSQTIGKFFFLGQCFTTTI